MKVRAKPRIAVAYNRDFEGAEADPENKARADIKGTSERVLEVLAGNGFDVLGVGVTADVSEALGRLSAFAPACVFNLCESVRGDNRFEALLPLLLEVQGIPYTGSGPFALSLALHKDKTKEVLRARGVPTPKGVVLRSAEVGTLALRFPLMVKPTREDASVGISSASVVRDQKALEARVRQVYETYRQPVLVEEYIEGREIYVSVLERRGDRPQVFPFFEIDFSDMPDDRPRIVSFEGKWVEDSVEFRGTKPVRCEGLTNAMRRHIAETALDAFAAIELRDYGRLDVRLSSDGTPYIIDVNPNCDLSDLGGGYAKAAKAAGLTYDDVLVRLVELAIERRADAHKGAAADGSRSADDADQELGGESVSARGDLVRPRAARRRAGSG